MAYKVPKLPHTKVSTPKMGKVSGGADAAAIKAANALAKESMPKVSGRHPAVTNTTFSAHPGHGSAGKTAQQVANELEKGKTAGMASQLAPF